MKNQARGTKTSQTAEQTDELLDVLDVLQSRIKKQNSFRNAFFKGLVYGLGTVIGATVVVAIFGGLIASTLETLTGEEINSELVDPEL